jgi:transcriptional regulator with XRE-family HTH domain
MSTNRTMYRALQSTRRAAFAAELINRMTAVAMDQHELAKATGIPRDQISRYCSAGAFPGQKNQVRLAQALNCDRTDLLSSWNTERLKGDYLSVRNTRNNLVSIELKKVVSLQQANRIMQILETDAVA